MVRSKKSIVLNAMLNTKNPHQNASLSIMGCPVINSFSLSRNAVTVWFSWSRCETEFGVGDTCQESAPGKGKEEKQEWTERESKLQCGFNKALASLGEWWGGGVALEWQRPVTGALGHAEMAGSCLLYSVTWPGDSCPGNARPGVRWVFSCCQTAVTADHTLHSQTVRPSLKGGSGKLISWSFRVYHLHLWGLLSMYVSRVAPSKLQWASLPER